MRGTSTIYRYDRHRCHTACLHLPAMQVDYCSSLTAISHVSLLTALTTLSLRGCGAALTSLAPLRPLSGLTCLDIRGCHAPGVAEEVREFCRSRLRCRVYADVGAGPSDLAEARP